MQLRTYMFAVGAAVLVALYLDWDALLYGVAALVGFEGLTNLKLTRLGSPRRPTPDGDRAQRRWRSLEADRMWRLTVAALLVVSHGTFPDVLWFIPWFFGFAIAGAGLSGVCPILMMLRAAGCR